MTNPERSQCAPTVIYYSQYCLVFANNSWSSELAAPAWHPPSCSSQRKQSGHWLTMWFFPELPILGYLPIRIRLFGVPGSSGAGATSREFSRCAFCQRRAAMLCPEIPAQKSLQHFLTPARASPVRLFCGKMGKGTFPTATNIAREMWVGVTDFISKRLSSLKNFISKLLCPTENSGQVF